MKWVTQRQITHDTTYMWDLILKWYKYLFTKEKQTHRSWDFKSWATVCLVAQSCLTLCNPMDRSLPGFSVHGILQARRLDSAAISSSRGSSQTRDLTQVFLIAGGFFTIWATGKLKNTAAGSLSLLQRIFPTQESNRGLLYCRWILYQLSYQGIIYLILIFQSSYQSAGLIRRIYLIFIDSSFSFKN